MGLRTVPSRANTWANSRPTHQQIASRPCHPMLQAAQVERIEQRYGHPRWRCRGTIARVLRLSRLPKVLSLKACIKFNYEIDQARNSFPDTGLARVSHLDVLMKR
jgi:hypothetical protein